MRRVAAAVGLVLAGVLVLGGAFELAVRHYVEETRHAFGVPHAAFAELPACHERQQRWWAGVCGDPVAVAGAPFTDVRVPLRTGGSLGAWWIPAAAGLGAPVVIYAHGIGQHRREGLRFLPVVRDAGWSMLIIDHPNHGTSTNDGTGATFGIRERLALLEAATWVRTTYGAPRVVLMGVSMGGASSVLAAAADVEGAVDGVIMEGVFASLPEVLLYSAEQRGLPRVAALVVADRMRETLGPYTFTLSPAGAIAAVSPRPLLMIVDGADKLVPAWHSDLLWELSRPPHRRVDFPSAGHGMAVTADPATFKAEVTAFLGSLAPAAADAGHVAP